MMPRLLLILVLCVASCTRDSRDLTARAREGQPTKRITLGTALKARGQALPGDTISADLGDGVQLEFVWIPPGEFMMGSPGSEPGRCVDEGPQHHVTFGQGFWIGKFEVTQEQWYSVMGANPSRSWEEGGRPRKLAPVENVSWYDCQDFCRVLNGRYMTSSNGYAGITFRLPTEAEWEYACRARTSSRFCTGNEDNAPDSVGWYADNSSTVPHTVGQKNPNNWGVYDMHGNVWEWCQDRYGKYSTNITDANGEPASRRTRISRGGSWQDWAQQCRSSTRSECLPESSDGGMGFRVVASQ